MSIQLVLQIKKYKKPNQTTTLIFKQNSYFGGKSVWSGVSWVWGFFLKSALFSLCVGKWCLKSLAVFNTGKNKKISIEVRSGLSKESTQNIHVNYITKIDSKHFIKMCGKYIEMAEKKYGIQDLQNVVTGCRLSFFLGLAISFAMLEVPSYAKNYIQKHLSNQPRQRSREGNIIMFFPVQGRMKPR